MENFEYNTFNYLLKENNYNNQTIEIRHGCIIRIVIAATWEIFSEFVIFCNLFHEPLASEIKVKYEKRGKYLPILHETMCNNYFIVKCLLKSNVVRVILLTY